MSEIDFDACAHPLGIVWDEELARAINEGKKVRIVLEGRFTKVESKEVAVFHSECGGVERPLLQSLLTFKPDWSSDYIELDTTPVWKDAPT